MAARILAHESVIDKYGNESEAEVYRAFLKNDEASKVNWSLGKDNLVYSVLPNVWEVTLDNKRLLGK